MAYSRTPETSSHQSARLPVAGSMTLPSFLQTGTGMKYYNCMPRTIKQNGQDPVHVLEKRPYYTDVSSSFIPTGGLFRGAFTAVGLASGYVTVALGTGVYINGNVSPSMTLVHASGHVGFTEARIGANNYIIALETDANNARVHVFHLQSLTNTVVALGVGAQGDPVFLNGRVYVAGYRTQRIYNSAVGNLASWTPANDFIDAEQVGDMLVTLGLHRNHLVAFGTNSVEFFSDVGYEIGSPLLRQATYSSFVGMPYYGYTTSQNFIAYVGNDVYFRGIVAGTQCVLRIRDFKITKASNDYIDRLISSATTNQYSLFSTTAYGRPCVVFSTVNAIFVYSVEEDTWAIWETMTTNFVPIAGALRPFLTGTSDYPLVFGYIAPTGTPKAYLLSPVNSTSPGDTVAAVSSYMIFDTFDGGTEFQKHFKFVDVVGDLGDSVVTLSFTKDASKNSSSFTLTNDSSGEPMRFRNLCRAKRLNLKITFTGKTQIEFRGLDVYYNLGTH